MKIEHSTETDSEDGDSGVIALLCSALPQLPSVLNYYDDFDDTTRSIRDPAARTIFEMRHAGQNLNLDFARFGPKTGYIFKHVFAFILAQDLSIKTAHQYVSGAMHLTDKDISALIVYGPLKISTLWKALRAANLPSHSYKAAKYLLHLLCAYRLYGWSRDYAVYVSTALPLPAIDKYSGIRAGDVFLSAEEEARIVSYLDQIVQRLKPNEPRRPKLDELIDAGMLLCSYQFGMRPIQIAKLEMQHVRMWVDEFSNSISVHLTFHMAKQRGDGNRIAMTRKIKSEWVALFAELIDYWNSKNVKNNQRIFQVDSSNEAGTRIASLVRALIDSDDLGTATDLRHTAAQRLVDAGASHEELAEFLGHSQTNTGLVYYATSASHADRVNRALGISEIYQRVAKIAHDRFISLDELTQLKGEQQISAVPHGIPISGIGGCKSGQPACPFNPITSCYGCQKFMPVLDKTLHEKVLVEMRQIVHFFESSSRGDTRSPAYLQLQRTIADVQAVISELDENSL